MAMKIHKSEERGGADYGWLKTKHSFSFGNYYNPQRMGFGALRVLNDDIIAPGRGFGMHDHQDMEIITIVLQGAVGHKDSMGNEKVVAAGEVQHMSAGSGVMHAEYNPSSTKPLHLLQIWVTPKEMGIEPMYEQKKIPPAKANTFVTIASHKKSKQGLYIHQDARFMLGTLQKGAQAAQKIGKGKGLFVFVIDGQMQIGAEKLGPGDSARISGQAETKMKALSECRALLVEVPV